MRDHELRFNPTEKLFRRICKRHLIGSDIDPDALKLQISVCRSTFLERGDLSAHSHPSFNGWVEIGVAGARICAHGNVNISCIDEPSKQDQSHALIALWTNVESSVDIDKDIEAARTRLAASMKVTVHPTK